MVLATGGSLPNNPNSEVPITEIPVDSDLYALFGSLPDDDEIVIVYTEDGIVTEAGYKSKGSDVMQFYSREGLSS